MRPRPTLTSAPTMLRTIWWQNAEAVISKVRSWPSPAAAPPLAVHDARWTRRTSDTSGT